MLGVIRLKKSTAGQFAGTVIALGFFKTLLLEFVSAGFSFGSVATYVIYFVLIMHMTIGMNRHGLITKKFLLQWAVIMMCFGLFYLFGDESTRAYYYNTEMILVYVYYIPMALAVVPALSSLPDLFVGLKKFRVLAIAMSAVMIFGWSYASGIGDSYMAFSYALLPFILYCFYSAYALGAKLDYVLFALGTIECMIFGARMPIIGILFFVVGILVLDIFANRTDSKKKILLIVAIVLCAALMFLFQGKIESALYNFASSTNSYALTKLFDGRFFSSGTRDVIYDNAIALIQQKNGMPMGLFADRVYLGVIYVHNIFLELMIDFGFLPGLLISIWIVFLIVKSFFINKKFSGRAALLFMFIAVFLRFLVSGSYLVEGMSFVYLSILICFSRNRYS